jgi:hypothetical protein
LTSRQHARWNSLGLRWQLAWPQVALRDRLRRYGYTVYDIGDTRHLDHVPPEDHTPYSETGWPIKATEYTWVTAIDIMPPPSRGLPSLQRLGAQMLGDRKAGHGGITWLKYMNWEPVGNNTGPCYHEQFQDGGYRQFSSSDRGHIHLSCRSDALRWTSGNTYDPVARVRGQLDDEEAPMPFVAHDGNTGKFYVSDLMVSREVPDSHLQDVIYLAQQLNYGHGAPGVEWSHDGWVREGWSEAAFGTLQGKFLVPVGESTDQPAPLSGTVAVSGTLTLSAPE